jgi:uncharacterized protein (TIRG00374 family)
LADSQIPSYHKSRLGSRVRSRVAVSVTFTLFTVGTILLVYLLRNVDWTQFREVGPLYLALILLLSVLSIGFYALAVYLLIQASGHKTTFLQTYLVLTASLGANYVTPVRVGIPLRIYLYKHLMDVPMSTGTALITMEVIVGMLTPAFIAVAGIACIFPSLGLKVPLILISVLVAGLLFVLQVRVENLQPYIERFPFLSFVTRLMRFVERIQGALRQLLITKILGVVVLNLLVLGVQAVRLGLVLSILGFSLSPLALLAVLAISLTAGNLSMIPMGLGVRDASFTLLLAQLGIPSEIAISVAVIQRLFSPGWPLLLGLISANILGVSELLKCSDTMEHNRGQK